MEPVTHLLTGACLARAGCNRRTAYATLAMTLAAEAPDLDMAWIVRGPVAVFEHHRGWTHSFLGVPFEAAAIVGGVWLWHRWRWRRESTRTPLVPEGQPTAGSRRRSLPAPHWGLLYLFSVIGLLSHLLLDWTNNYGVRPFFPFNPRWYAGSFVSLFEPVIFALLLIGLVAPALFGLVGSEVGVRKEPFRGRGWAIFALSSIALLYGWRGFERISAERLALGADYGGVEILRSAVSPYPITPFTWHAVVETSGFYQVATVDTWNGTVATSVQEDVFHKPAVTLAMLAAKRSWLGQIYLDWSQFALVTDSGPDQDGISTVTFRDLRFFHNGLLVHGRSSSPPLSGSVQVNQDRRIVHTEMDGRVQR